METNTFRMPYNKHIKNITPNKRRKLSVSRSQDFRDVQLKLRDVNAVRWIKFATVTSAKQIWHGGQYGARVAAACRGVAGRGTSLQ